MRATFKETWTSVRDLGYGQVIIKKTVGQVFWYWFKYVLVISLVLIGLAVASLTYFTPQLSKFVAKSAPDIKVSIENGKLNTNAIQPLVFGDDNFKFILNTKGKSSDIDKIQAGVLILGDKLLVKNGPDIRSINFSEVGSDIKFDKKSTVSWLEGNKMRLLGIGLGAILLIGAVLMGTYVGWKIIVFLIAALLLWLVAKIAHRRITYTNGLKIIAYAAVPALFISFIPGQLGATLSLGIWIFLSCGWLLKLPLEIE